MAHSQVRLLFTDVRPPGGTPGAVSLRPGKRRGSPTRSGRARFHRRRYSAAGVVGMPMH